MESMDCAIRTTKSHATRALSIMENRLLEKRLPAHFFDGIHEAALITNEGNLVNQGHVWVLQLSDKIDHDIRAC